MIGITCFEGFGGGSIRKSQASIEKFEGFRSI